MGSSTKLKAAEADLRKVSAKAKEARKSHKNAAGKKKDLKDTVSRQPPKSVLVTAADTVKNPEVAQELAASRLTPPHRYDIHLKKEELTVIVTLHNVPPQKIDADQTTDECFVLSTPNHTKRFYLSLPFPHGMRVDSSRGDYTFENGELKAVFPIVKMPAEVVREWTERLESIRRSQKARFDVSKDGDLVVRHRKTKLALQESAAKKKSIVAKRAPDATVVTPSSASPGEPAIRFATDDKEALKKMAAHAAATVQQSLKKRLEIAREAENRRQGRSLKAAATKEAKANKMSEAFERVLAQKRAALEQMKITLERPVEAPLKGSAVRKVKFS